MATALHHTTSSSCGEVTATIATTPKKHNSNHLPVRQWIRSAIRDSQQTILAYRFSIFVTSATALCGTTGIC